MKYMICTEKLKLVFISVIILLMPVFIACGTDSGTDGPAATRKFYATDLTDNSVYTVTADLVYEGGYCLVYKDRNDTSMDDSTAQTMGKEFDDNIYGKIRTYFGAPSDVDDNDKIIILVLDILDGGSGGSYVAGYFHPVNEFSRSSYSMSNESDMLYMDSDPGATYPDAFRETMAHEFQHLVCFNQKVFVQGSSAGFDTWIDEGMSSAAEKIYKGSQITDKINYFNSDPYKDIAKGQRFIAWDKGSYASVLGNYATVYLFFQWLNIQSDNDYSIYKIIMNSSYADYRAVYAAKSELAGFTGSSFSELMRDWNIANLASGSSGILSYEGEISTAVHYINDYSDNPSYTSGQTRAMLPGECVYAKAVNYSLADTAGIDAAGVNTSTYAVDTDSTGGYSGDVLLAYNTSSADSSATSTTGALPAGVASVVSGSSMKAYSLYEKRYPVDAVFRLEDLDKLK